MDEFFARLKQRKIVQWALAYVAASFAFIQVIDIVAQRFGWPEHTVRFIIIALAVGFFVMLVLAWYHGERGTQRVTGPELLFLALLLTIGGAVAWRLAPTVTEPNGQPGSASTAQSTSISGVHADSKSIAVLPFENLSDDKANAYFAEGMQEEILTRLAGIGELKVISRTSTEKYKSHPDNLKIVAGELGVANILEGSVQKAGEAVRVNVQLIDARNDMHLWAQTYDRELKNVFVVESEVAQQIAAVWRDLDIQDRVRRINSAERCSDFGVSWQNQKPVAVVRQLQLARTAKHSLRFHAAQLADFNFQPVRQSRSGQGNRHFVAGFIILRATHDLPVVVRPIVYIANAETIGIRMLRRGVNQPDHDVIDFGAPLLHAFDFNAREREQSGYGAHK